MSEVKRRFEHNTNLALENSPKEQVWLMPREDKSIKALSNFIDEKWKLFDMIYIDGSHHAQDVLGDLVLSFNLLEKGGIMICDDYLWAQNHPDMRFTPRIAINAFTEIWGDKIVMLQAPLYQVYMKKVAD